MLNKIKNYLPHKIEDRFFVLSFPRNIITKLW